uniref:BolA family member 3 n=1 Tax=Anser brachyrhynchus TaxID=132585 RepID=A0A8B9CC52_9AVES
MAAAAGLRLRGPLVLRCGPWRSFTSRTDGEARVSRVLREKFPRASAIRVVDISGGCGAMYEVHIESEEFREKRPVQQHQMVNQVRAAAAGARRLRCAPARSQALARSCGTTAARRGHAAFGPRALSLLGFASCLHGYAAALHAVCLRAWPLQLTQQTLHLHLSAACIQHLIRSSTLALNTWCFKATRFHIAVGLSICVCLLQALSEEIKSMHGLRIFTSTPKP